MAVNEISGFLKYKDLNGDINLLMPITTKDNVDGLDEIEESLNTTVKFTAQSLTDAQKEQARSNIGVSAPDWNASEGEPGYVLNRTHYTDRVEGLTITEEMIANPLETAALEEGYYFLKVSDKVFASVDELIGIEVVAIDSGEEVSNTYTADEIVDRAAEGMYLISINDEVHCVYKDCTVPVDDTTSITLTTGVWATSAEGFAIKSVQFPSSETVHKLDPKYLPDGVPYVIEGAGGFTEILPECQPVYDEEDMLFVIEGEPPVFEIGAEYTINWNGTEYTCECMDSAVAGDTGGYVFGDIYTLSGGQVGSASTGEPFVMVVYPGQGMMIVPLDGSTSVTLSIYQGGGAEVRKLDGRCLPSGVPYIEGEGTMKTVLAETTFNDVTSPIQQSMNVIFGVGKTYIVNWNGTEYTCTGYLFNDTYTLIGNQKIALGYGTDSGEPFCMGNVDGQFIILYNDGSTSVTVSIVQDGTVYHKIDERLLPEIDTVTYELQKSGSTIKLVGSDGSETSIEDSNTTYTLKSFGVTANVNLINNIDKLPGRNVAGETFSIDGVDVTAGAYAEVFNSISTNIASGSYSHAEGSSTIASGTNSHAEGSYTIASGTDSHAEGSNTTASGYYSHAKGYNTTASGYCSHAEGYSTHKLPDTITKDSTNDEIVNTWEQSKFSLAKEQGSHVEGNDTLALGSYSHAEGSSTIASSYYSHAEGKITTASSEGSHAEGYDTTASGLYSHAEGSSTTASGDYSHAEGYDTTASGWASHAEGSSTTASGRYSHAEGYDTTASGESSHAEGFNTTASGRYSHAEGYSLNKLPDTITKDSTNDEIVNTRGKTNFSLAKGYCSHVEGCNSLALGEYSHAEGRYTTASGLGSHAEGDYATASGNDSHAEGRYTTASGLGSHAEGYDTTASGSYQHVQGQYNIEDTEDNYAHIVGNGDSTTRSNAHTLDWDGNAWFAGDVYVGSTSGTNKDDGSKKLATESYVDEAVASIEHPVFTTGVTTEGDGTAYTVTIDGVTELTTGLQFVMIPHTTSTTTSVTLNVNGLGAKLIRQRLSTNTSVGVVGATANWIVANKPVTVTYNGTAWVVEITRPDANNLYGTVKVENGGVPSTSDASEGAFLRIVDGVPTWVVVPSAEEASF